MQEKILRSDLLADRIFKRTVNALSRYRHVIIGALLMGLMAYLYMFTNKIPNHDDLRALFHKGTTFAGCSIWPALVFPPESWRPLPWAARTRKSWPCCWAC